MAVRRHLSSSTRRVRESSALWQSFIISRLLGSTDFSRFISFLPEPVIYHPSYSSLWTGSNWRMNLIAKPEPGVGRFDTPFARITSFSLMFGWTDQAAQMRPEERLTESAVGTVA